MMKANLLVIITIVILTGAYGINELLTFDSPAIDIRGINVINSSNGDKTVCYTINLYSPSQINGFVAEPNIAGGNDDSVLDLKFDGHTRRATVVYYYVIPQERAHEKIEIKFCLSGKLCMADCVVSTANL